ncbi:MAG: glycoside hydrolase family 3 N-terminal domain-containing protein, partial [Pseudohongiellaceae bacterium]
MENTSALQLVRETDDFVASLIAQMDLAEKIGQMCQIDVAGEALSEELKARLSAGEVGSIINQVDVELVNEIQRVAVEESRLGIPLLIGRDVIHGFKTVLPIPIGQAASWNRDLVEAGARISALEAARAGVNWTFAPMLDIARDPRWGRVAESFGEDPFLASVLGAAMVSGFQGQSLRDNGSIAACAKHFAGYGAAESGRDYATTNIPENELRNVYLQPFHAAVTAGAATVMTSFGDLNGIPCTANGFLLRQILREEWGFSGFVVSDWDSVFHLKIHGLTADDAGSALEAAQAGVDMEMASTTYKQYLAQLVEQGKLSESVIDQAVARILRLKLALGLFENPYTEPEALPAYGNTQALDVARQTARESIVMLKNAETLLPLSANTLRSIAVVGPLADAPYEQLGTWIFDGDSALSVTPLEAIRRRVGPEVEVNFFQAMATSRDRNTDAFEAVAEAAGQSDVVLMFLGEESILSGEAHCRADINLPGAQAELVRKLKAAGKPIIAVILAGRPLTLTNVIDEIDALLFAWHPGTMGGEAISDLLFGDFSPSGKLPVSFPRHVGQVPVYYNHKNSGKPPSDDAIVHIDDIDANATQT